MVSMALPPVNNYWNLFVLEHINNFIDRRDDLARLVKFSLDLLKKLNIKTESTSHIISVVIGENSKTIQLSEILKEQGYLAYSIKEPTVPKNTARLRISLTADMKKEDLENFFYLLKNEMVKLGVL